MKVLHVIPSVAPVRGGPSRAVLEMVQELCRQGIEAEIATTNDNGDETLDVPLHQRTQYPCSQSLDLKDITHSQVPIWFFLRFSPPLPALREFAFSASFSQWLWQHVTDYDLIHIHAIFSYPSTIAMTIARLKGIPYIVRPIGQLCHWSLQQGARKKQVYFQLIERANLIGSSALHFTSIQEQQEASKLDFQVPSFILPHGLQLPQPIDQARQQLRAHLRLTNSDPIITFLSRLHPKKGLDQLITGLSYLPHQRFNLVIAGSGSSEYEAKIHQLLQQSGLADRSHQVGFANGHLKNLLLQGSDLFALTSHSENFGIAVLEALAAGTPALVTPGVALSTLVEQHDLGWITDQEPAAIAQIVEIILAQPQLLQTKGDRAHHVIQTEFTWSRAMTNLIGYYENILAIRSMNRSVYSFLSQPDH